MSDYLLGHYAYWFLVILLVIGLYGMLLKENLVKKVIGLTIFQSAIVLFFVAVATKREATVPVWDAELGTDVATYMNPLPHTLMLTAIVVGVAVIGVAFALLIAVYRNYGTLDESELFERMK